MRLHSIRFKRPLASMTPTERYEASQTLRFFCVRQRCAFMRHENADGTIHWTAYPVK